MQKPWRSGRAGRAVVEDGRLARRAVRSVAARREHQRLQKRTDAGEDGTSVVCAGGGDGRGEAADRGCGGRPNGRETLVEVELLVERGRTDGSDWYSGIVTRSCLSSNAGPVPACIIED